MKKLLAWLGVTLLPACCAMQGSRTVSDDKQTLAEQLEHETTALVKFIDDNGANVAFDSPDVGKANLVTYCAGVWVSPTVMLTAEHCVDEIGKPPEKDSTVQQLLELLENGKVLEVQNAPSWSPVGQPVMYSVRDDIGPHHKAYRHGTVSAVDMNNDVALITTPETYTHPIAHLSTRRIHDGDEVHVVGQTSGMWWTYVHGYVSSYRPQWADGRGHFIDALQISAPIYFGNSGGGAFDNNGDLIAMADAVHMKVPDVGLYVHRDVLRVFLEHNHVIAASR